MPRYFQDKMLFVLKLVKFAVQNDSLCLNLNKIHVT